MTDGCLRCAELRRRFRDPQTVNTAATVHVWARHRIRDHEETAEPRPGCGKCAEYQTPARGVHPRVWEIWGQQHYMICALVPEWVDAQEK